MAIRKLQVFLASRFGEFQLLRAELGAKINALKIPPVVAIDLNDNAADPFPPLRRCYEEIDQSELFVLLVGDTYGTSPENHQESYTHLEYKHALEESKTILPFLIGRSHRKQFESRHYQDHKLAAWVSEIRAHHTPSYLEPDTDDLANDIFNEVLARLIELFVEVDEGELDVGDDVERRLEDSPIKLEELANAPGRSTDRPNNQPLKMLAADHAKEALAALKLHLPQVAIHHLTKATELVPLDIVLGYWLARLLIATGQRAHCKKGRQVALLCARVASAQEAELDLETMACNVLAARASERLGEMDLALEYAEAAHEGMPYHWLAKVEHGHQLALAGDRLAALERAKEAFWLRPESINQIQSDTAYRGLRKDFDDFRGRLRQNVTNEIDAISRVESRIKTFEMQLDHSDSKSGDSDYSIGVLEPSNSEFIGSPQPEPAIDMQRVESRSILRLVHDGRLSARRSLEILQRCAKQLAKDAVVFEFGSRKGYTPDIKDQIQETINVTNEECSTLAKNIREADREAETLNEGKRRLMLTSLWVGGMTLILVVAAYLADYASVAIGLAAIGSLAGWLGYTTFKRLESNISAALIETNKLRRDLANAKSILIELKGELHSFEQGELGLRGNVHSFRDLVNQFESVALKRVTLSPVVPMDRRGNSMLVRTDPAKAVELQVEIDSQLLTPDLSYLVENSAATSRFWVARRVRTATSEVLSHSAAYFQ